MLQLDEAVTAIKAAMTWDEAAFGREYDLVRHKRSGTQQQHVQQQQQHGAQRCIRTAGSAASTHDSMTASS